ncbi:MAG: NAD(P)H dehydrogenase, partial [Anaerolineae bacterium]|nr:NAD(P)H dehydrogenase [Anaerolineae bacterium]
EPDHNQYALSMCRLFATRNGFEWAGGLGIGAGEVAKGRLLTDMGGMTANLVRALDLSAESLAAGGRIPDEAIALAARPLMPAWLYRLAGQFGWLSQARHYGVLGKLRQRVWTPVERSD